jgi:hypothetical protein
MVDGPAIGRLSSGSASSSWMLSKPGELGLVLSSNERFGLSLAFSLALSSQCSYAFWAPCQWRGWAGSLRSQTFGCLHGSLGSGECSRVEGTVDFAGDCRDSLQRDWLWDMAAIGEGDRLGAGC